MKTRYITASIEADLADKMVFVGGPRQVGKTTLALMKKLYFWDWSRVKDSGPRFENMVAGQLLKYCHLVEDTEGYDMELRYLRDTDKREVDFVVLREGRPAFAVECKSGERDASPACRYFRERTDIPTFYQVHLGERDFGNAETHTRVLPFATFCRELALP